MDKEFRALLLFVLSIIILLILITISQVIKNPYDINQDAKVDAKDLIELRQKLMEEDK